MTTDAPFPLVPIADSDELYRRIVDHQIDPTGRVNSSAFKTGKSYDNAISVEIARLTTLEECLHRPPRRIYGVAGVRAITPRTLGFTVRHVPLPDIPCHAQIEGENTRVKSKLLAEQMYVLVAPPARQLL
ncbi:MAG: hypothetical protein LC793_09590 [Thermomicrobia bacterium]|nr:hypothetical protein [Thermomicrobia bacterium]